MGQANASKGEEQWKKECIVCLFMTEEMVTEAFGANFRIFQAA